MVYIYSIHTYIVLCQILLHLTRYLPIAAGTPHMPANSSKSRPHKASAQYPQRIHCVSRHLPFHGLSHPTWVAEFRIKHCHANHQASRTPTTRVRLAALSCTTYLSLSLRQPIYSTTHSGFGKPVQTASWPEPTHICEATSISTQAKWFTKLNSQGVYSLT